MTPKRILVVDDEEEVAQVLQYVLEDEGYAVVTANSMEQALAEAAEGGFAAAVLDVSMGEVSGIEIARALKAGIQTAHTPIVILTGMAERAVRDQFTGYDLFMSKGADLSEFVAKLAALIGPDDVGELSDTPATA